MMNHCEESNMDLDENGDIHDESSKSSSGWHKTAHFNTKEKIHFLEISQDKKTIKYTGKGQNAYDVGSIRCNKPFPSDQLISYYEITIDDAGARGTIGMGLSEGEFTLNRKPGWEAGYNIFSYGYHADGKKYCNNCRGDNYGASFTTGDTIGCGLVEDSKIFFTKNGQFLGYAFHNVADRVFYPTVGLHSNGEIVSVNFGDKQFKFDVDELIMEEKDKRRKEIEKVEIPVCSISSIVRDYLLHFGYEETLASFEQICDIKRDDNIKYKSLSNRKRVRGLIMKGDISGAIELTHKLYDGLLNNEKQIYFLLHCQQFIEMVKQRQIEEAVVFAQKVLCKYWETESGKNAAYLKDCCALLCYTEPESSPVNHLLEMSHRESIADKLNNAILRQDCPKGECISKLERLIKHLTAVRQTIRQENGEKGEIFSLQKYLNSEV